MKEHYLQVPTIQTTAVLKYYRYLHISTNAYSLGMGVDYEKTKSTSSNNAVIMLKDNKNGRYEDNINHTIKLL
jgi:hypothetical protein